MKNDVIHADREIDMTNLIGAFRDCTNEPINEYLSHINPLKKNRAIPSVLEFRYLRFPPDTIHLHTPYGYHNHPTNHYFYLMVFTEMTENCALLR